MVRRKKLRVLKGFLTLLIGLVTGPCCVKTFVCDTTHKKASFFIESFSTLKEHRNGEKLEEKWNNLYKAENDRQITLNNCTSKIEAEGEGETDKEKK